MGSSLTVLKRVVIYIAVMRIFFYCDGQWPSEMVTIGKSFKTELGLSFKSLSLPVGKRRGPLLMEQSSEKAQ